MDATDMEMQEILPHQWFYY